MEEKFEGNLSPEMELNAEERKRRHGFRVAVFGTGREEDQAAIRLAGAVSANMVDKDFSIVTGGYDVGVMKAATEAGIETSRQRERTDDAVIAIPFDEQAAADMPPIVKDVKVIKARTLMERWEYLVEKADSFIVLGGQFGTVAELTAAMQSEFWRNKNKQFPERPIVILDPTLGYTDFLEYVGRKDGRVVDSTSFKNMYLVANEQDGVGRAGRIIELYYDKAAGKNIGDDDQRFLDTSNLQFLTKHSTEEAEAAGFHF